LTLQTIEQPENLNAMYLIANQWLKVHTKTTSAGYGTTFVTTLDHQEKPKRGKKNEKNKKEESKKTEKDKETKGKDLNEIECFACGESGHYANRCPSRQKKDNEEVKKDTVISHPKRTLPQQLVGYGKAASTKNNTSWPCRPPATWHPS